MLVPAVAALPGKVEFASSRFIHSWPAMRRRILVPSNFSAAFAKNSHADEHQNRGGKEDTDKCNDFANTLVIFSCHQVLNSESAAFSNQNGDHAKGSFPAAPALSSSFSAATVMFRRCIR